MRFVELVSVALLVGGCTRQSPERPDDLDAGRPVEPARAPEASSELPLQWETKSFDGQAVLSSRGDEGRCEVRCTARGQAVWERRECIATRNDLRFVSPACDVVAVLWDAPRVEGSVAATVVGRVWKPGGEATAIRLHQVASPDSVALSASGKWFSWLAGTLDRGGTRPRYDAAGTGIELDTLDGKRVVLTFAELREWVDRPPAVVSPQPMDASVPVAEEDVAAGDDELFRWLGDDGVEHIGLASQIPEKFKKRAKRIDTEVGIVKSDEPKQRNRPSQPTSGGAASTAAPDRCVAARQRVEALEQQISALKPPAECAANPTVRTATGASVFDGQERLRCMTGREAGLKAFEAQKAQLEQQKAAAQEELRRVQVSGC